MLYMRKSYVHVAMTRVGTSENWIDDEGNKYSSKELSWGNGQPSSAPSEIYLVTVVGVYADVWIGQVLNSDAYCLI